MIPTHNHSEYSALDGYGTVVEIANRVEELALPGAWLTDHGTVAGVLSFAQEFGKRDLFWGAGMEAYQAPLDRKIHEPRVKGAPKNDSFHVILLAQTYEGYQNLLRLSDEANKGESFYYYPRVDWDLLERYKDGLICTSACMGGLVAQGIKNDDLTPFHKYREIFGEKFFVEIHTYDSADQRAMNKALMQVCEEWGVWPIVANDAHYPTKDLWDTHELMVAINEGRKFDPEAEDSARRHPPCLYIMSEDEVKSSLSYLDEDFVQAAIDNTDAIAEASRYTLPEYKVGAHLPKWPAQNGVSPAVQLIEAVEEWCADKPDEYFERACIELEALIDAGLQDYFLIVQEFCNWATRRGIMIGPGRGSVGGSVVAYALGITNVDPIKYGLFFERFWNPGRASGLPDIDVDFEQSRRPDVKDHLAGLYGDDRVRGIGNHIRFRPKSAIDRVAMSMGLPYQDARDISKIIDQTTDAGHLADWDEIMDLVGEELMPWVEKYPLLFHYAEAITNRLSTYGVHASAVVISDVDLPGNLPIMRRTDKDKNVVYVTAHDMYSVEAQGYPKFDLLGLKTLDVCKTTATLAGHPDFDYRSYDYNLLPDSYWTQLERGRTLGLFQIEQATSAKRIAKHLHARSVADLAPIVALNRPGPLRSGAVDKFLAVREGEAEAEYAHPFLEPILKETAGQIVYQEQVIQLCVALGYSLSDADHVRKILGKKKVEDMEAEEPRFLEAASAVMGDKVARQVWDEIKGFSKYSFNKSHAVGYGMITAWTMYAKWKWPQEFIMASIIVTPKRRGDFIGEARRMGVTVRVPDINKSGVTVSRVGDDIYLGLTEIKGIGAGTAQWVIDHRPEGGYESYEQFMAIHEAAKAEWVEADKRTRGQSPSQIVNVAKIGAMVSAGAFDSIMQRDVTLAEKMELEEQYFDMVVTDVWSDTIAKHQKRLDECMSYPDLEDYGRGKIAGIVRDVSTRRVKPTAYRNANEEMAFVTVEWEGEQMRLAAFPSEWKKYQISLRKHSLVTIQAEHKPRGAIIEKVTLLS